MTTRLAIHKNGQCVPYGARSGGSGATSSDLILSGSVGLGGHNQHEDVVRVQNALNSIPDNYGGPENGLNPDGVPGPATIGAIKDFQQLHFGFSDGKIDIFGRTHAKLSSFLPAKLQRMKTAQNYLSQARDCMLAAQAKILMASGELVSGLGSGGGGFMGTRNLDLADKHFDVGKGGNPGKSLSQIGNIYDIMIAVFQRPGGLLGWSAFEAEPFTNPDFYAYTYCGGYRLTGRYFGGERFDTIYLSGYYDRSTDDNRIQTIVHELSHFVGPATGDEILDYAYGQQNDAQMLAMTPYQKQHNAESFGNFAFEAKFGRFPL